MASSLPSRTIDQALPVCAQRIRVLIADETPLNCHLLKDALTRSHSRFDIVACTCARTECIRLLDAHGSDVVLVSESLQDGSLEGIDLANQLRVSFPATRVIMLLKLASRDLVIDAFRAGADGVFCRTEPIRALSKCIRVVHRGQIWANTDHLRFILEALINATPLRVIDCRGRYLLAPKENEIANLVAEGLTNREVAKKLEISEHTVSNHLFRIYEKLGISSRVELALYVVRQKQA